MPDARLQRTRDNYAPMPLSRLFDVILSMPPGRLSCGCHRAYPDPEDPTAPDVFFCLMHQNMGRAACNLPLLPLPVRPLPSQRHGEEPV